MLIVIRATCSTGFTKIKPNNRGPVIARCATLDVSRKLALRVSRLLHAERRR